MDKNTYCMTLRCELEAGEDTKYPLEDLLDEYHVRCTRDRKEFQEDGVRVFVFEVEGALSKKEKNLPNLQALGALAGGRAFNYTEGGLIKFGIEAPAAEQTSL